MSEEERKIYDELTSYGGENSHSGPIMGMKVYDGHSYFITVRLSDIFGAELTEVDDPETGEPRRGLFLPFKNSGLTVTPKKNVLLVCKAQMAQVASSKYTHLLTQIIDKTVAEARKKLGFQQNYIGHMRQAGPKPLKKRKK
jgi:hypothetical protein